jgi:hypothetical protein
VAVNSAAPGTLSLDEDVQQVETLGATQYVDEGMLGYLLRIFTVGGVAWYKLSSRGSGLRGDTLSPSSIDWTWVTARMAMSNTVRGEKGPMLGRICSGGAATATAVSAWCYLSQSVSRLYVGVVFVVL